MEIVHPPTHHLWFNVSQFGFSIFLLVELHKHLVQDSGNIIPLRITYTAPPFLVHSTVTDKCFCFRKPDT